MHFGRGMTRPYLYPIRMAKGSKVLQKSGYANAQPLVNN